MGFIKKHESISHLTDEQVDELIRRYYLNEKANSLVEEFQINVSPSKLYSVLPPETCKEMICPNCNVPMVKDRKSKTAYTNSSNKTNPAYCHLCGHTTDYNRCNCNTCANKKQEEAKRKAAEKKLLELRKIQQIEETYSLDKHKRIAYDSISFRDRVYLGTLLRACLSEDLTTILALESFHRKLAPTEPMVRELLVSLLKKDIILVNPNSPIEAFTENQDIEFPGVYYLYKVHFHLNLEFPQNKQEFIHSIMNPEEFVEINRDKEFELWKDIALGECLEYFKYQMTSVRFDFNPGEKTLTVFKELLNDFSVSQIYGIIYRSVAQTTKFYQEGNINRRQAANSVIGRCQRLGERAVIEKWDLSKYSRVKECAQSMLSEFFFNRILKIGDLGFDIPPTIL